MTSHPSHRPVSALRPRMIEDMTVHGFTEKTRNDYVRNVRAFAAFIRRSRDTATAEDLRRFQLHQTRTGTRCGPREFENMIRKKISMVQSPNLARA
jgi:integrase/recombinase XerD